MCAHSRTVTLIHRCSRKHLCTLTDTDRHRITLTRRCCYRHVCTFTDTHPESRPHRDAPIGMCAHSHTHRVTLTWRCCHRHVCTLTDTVTWQTGAQAHAHMYSHSRPRSAQARRNWAFSSLPASALPVLFPATTSPSPGSHRRPDTTV